MPLQIGIIKISFLVAISFLLLSATATATTYHVLDTLEPDSIQKTINTAQDGDRIIVWSGTYLERLNITKKLIIMGVDTGNGLPVVDAKERESAITLSADGIWLEGFWVQNSGSSGEDAGIKVFSNDNIIRGNILNNNSYGIYLKNSSGNEIEANQALKNDVGIALQSSNNNTIRNNIAANNSFAGFFSGNSRKNSILNNTGRGNKWVGFLLNNTENSTIQNNSAIKNANAGIWILNSRSNLINENNATLSPIFGFYIDSSFNNTLSKNTALRNLDGISMHESDRNIIVGNNISVNMFGMYIDKSNRNLIYRNNFAENKINAFSSGASNQWSSPYAINYLYKGLACWERMGNFWNDYRGEDRYESGIGSSAYIDEFIKDERPLLSRKENYLTLK